MLTSGRIYPGTSLRIEGDFTDVDGDLTDPNSVTFKLRSPFGVETSFVYLTDSEVIRTSEGLYTADVTVDVPGRWHYQWVVTGAGDFAVIGQGDILVQDTPFYDWSSLTDYT